MFEGGHIIGEVRELGDECVFSELHVSYLAKVRGLLTQGVGMADWVRSMNFSNAKKMNFFLV